MIKGERESDREGRIAGGRIARREWEGGRWGLGDIG